MTIRERAKAAKHASIRLAALDTETKDRALEAIAIRLEERKSEIIAANDKDYARSVEENSMDLF
jgi:glutamate-5-semialdehyde dehydrogenase (EC 1.2.1.41)